jgi:hypothetical protein
MAAWVPLAIGLGAGAMSAFMPDERRDDIRRALAMRMGDINRSIQGYRDTIAGKGTSVAENQLRRALGQSAAMQQGMAAGARPGQNAVLARRAAAQQGSALQASASGQAAMLRAQEQAQAQAQLAGLLTTLRSQDLQGVLGTMQVPTQQERFLGALQGGAQMYAQMQNSKDRNG